MLTAQVQRPTQAQKKALGITRLPVNQSLVVFFGPQRQYALVKDSHVISFEAGLGQMQPNKCSAGLKAATDEAAGFVRARLAHPTTTAARLQ